METTSRARRRATTFRRIGWLAVAAMATLGLVGPAAGPAFARSDLNVTVPFGPDYPGASRDCSGPFEGIASDQMGWHFIQNQTDATSGTLTVTFSPGGTQQVPSAVTNSNVLHWYVFSPAGATLTAASTNVGVNTDPGNFNLSHICVGSTTTTSSSSTTSTGTTSTDTGAVLGAAATPKSTPPPTDSLPTGGTPGGDSWRLALLAIAGLLATLLLLAPATPAKARRRR